MKKPLITLAGVTRKTGPKGEFLVGLVKETVTIPEGASVMVFKNKLNPPPDFNVVWLAPAGENRPAGDDEPW